MDFKADWQIGALVCGEEKIKKVKNEAYKPRKKSTKMNFYLN